MATTKDSARKRIILLDSHAIMHRAYHALPEFTSDTGEPTGALYGLVSMLIKIVKDLKPDYIIATYDLPDPTHRHEVYQDYKGTRIQIDEALVAQLHRATDVYEAFGIPALALAGYEADDILGTLAERLKKTPNCDIVIASGDHDTLQLVDDSCVKVFTMRKGMNDTVLYDANGVHARYGFGPEHIADYKGLRGDPSDNIKGIKGIGEKSATELIVAFGSIENIYKTLETKPEKFAEVGIKARIMKLLIEGKDDAVFSKMLATIKTDAPIVYELPQESWTETFDLTRALTFCDNLGFRSLMGRVKGIVPGAVVEEVGVSNEPSEESAEDMALLDEAAVALWLVHSDVTNPGKDDVLRFTKATTVEEAHTLLMNELRATGKLMEVFETIEKPLIPLMYKMKEVGIKIDVAHLKKLSTDYHAQLNNIIAQIYGHAGHEFNINSPKQLGSVLFDELLLGSSSQKKTSTGQRSTREEELEKLREAHPIIGAILEYRELQKLLSTYVDNLPGMVAEDGRLHARFLQAGTTTGRMASSDPNLQNIPTRAGYGKPIREGFIAEDGYTLVAIDYSQIELRIAAGLSGDEKLIEVFKTGGDIHTSVAMNVFDVPPEMVDAEMRRRAKVINFGILYGMGVNALRANLGESITRADAAKFLNEYFKSYQGLAHYLEEVKVRAAHTGFTETLFGRRRTFAGFDSSVPYIRAAAERMAINAPIQGTSADIIKLAMVRADAFLKEEESKADARLLLQVHDELVYEVKSEHAKRVAGRIRAIMESVVTPEQLRDVPIIAEVSMGETWGTLVRVPRSEFMK